MTPHAAASHALPQPGTHGCQWPHVDIVLVAWKSERWVAPCLDALASLTYPLDHLHIIFVENAGGDDAIGECRRWMAAHGGEAGPFGSVIIQQNPTNMGCAGGNNVGWRLGRSPLVLMLNLDTSPTPGFLQPLVARLLGTPQAGFVGAKLHFTGSRRLQHAGGMIYGNGMADHYFNGQEDAGQADTPRRVDFVTGACLLTRRNVLEALGGLDEDFNPAYYEETDLCRRGARLGWETWYEPASAMEHHESAGLGGRRADAFLRAIYRNRVLFVLKHWTLADFIEHFIPTERWWFTIQESRSARPYQVRAYLQALGFLLRATVTGWGITPRVTTLPSNPPPDRSPA